MRGVPSARVFGQDSPRAESTDIAGRAAHSVVAGRLREALNCAGIGRLPEQYHMSAAVCPLSSFARAAAFAGRMFDAELLRDLPPDSIHAAKTGSSTRS